jgi:hypothetical protein
LTIVAFLLQRDEAADESDHRIIPLQLDKTAGRWVPEAFGRNCEQLCRLATCKK